MSFFRIFLYLKIFYFLISFFKNKKNIENEICKKFNKITKKKYSILTSHLRVGFYLVLKYLKLVNPEKNEIIISSYNLAEMVNICENLKLKLVFSKLNKNLSLSSNDLIKDINKKTLCVVTTNIFNDQNDIIDVKKICKKNNIPLIEDNAIYFGNYYKTKKIKVFAGSFGDYTLHSFNIMKNISGMFGGMVSTNNKDFLNYARNEIKNFKRFPFLKYFFQCQTFLILKVLSNNFIYKPIFLPLTKWAHKNNINYVLKILYPSLKFKKTIIPNNYFTKISRFSLNMIWLQLEDIKYFKSIQQTKEKNNLFYYRELKKKNIKGVKLIKLNTSTFQNFNDFPIIVERKNELLKYLLSNGVETKFIQYVDCQKIFNNIKRSNKNFYENKILCLPNHIKIKENYINFIVYLISDFYKKKIKSF